jgi:acetyl-CoA C-acetyltransferase
MTGAGQINDRDFGSEPIDLMARCTEAALDDSGSPAGLRAAIDAVRVVWGVWPYRDPGRLVADRIGATEARTALTTVGGNQVYDLVIDTANQIVDGRTDAAVLCAAESLRTRRADHARGERTEYLTERDDAAPDEPLGKEHEHFNAAEKAIGVDRAVMFYAMAETALRHRLGEDVETHKRRIAELWAGASVVAADNPHAWLRTELSADDIAVESDRNRPVAAPYPKLLTSNLNVDQGGAVIMCAAEVAARAGIPHDRWVFPWAGAGAADHWFPTNRWAFDESPAMRLSAEATLGLAGVGIDDVALLDLYSCFPVAVQVAQRELGISPDRPFTITGGLTFAAGPLNCYCILPLTRSVELLRNADDDDVAFLTGNGGMFTKHSALVLGGRPASDGFRSTSPQSDVDVLPSRPDPEGPAANGSLEAYTVTFDRDQRPERAIMAVLDDDGRRHWMESSHETALDAMTTTDCCGRTVEFDGSTGLLT